MKKLWDWLNTTDVSFTPLQLNIYILTLWAAFTKQNEHILGILMILFVITIYTRKKPTP